MSKKGGKGGKKGKGGGIDEATQALQEQLQRAMLRIEALERDLFAKKEQARQAIRAKNELQARVIKYDADMEEERTLRNQIMSQMTQQYADQRHVLSLEHDKIERQLHDVEEKLAEIQAANEEALRKKQEEIERKNAEIAEQKRHIEAMTQDFSSMLHETLNKMTEKMKQSSELEDTPLDVPADPPSAQRT